MKKTQTITPQMFCARLKSGEPMAVLDVRTAMEHRARHLVCAHDFIPLDQLDAAKWTAAHPETRDKPIYIICASGKRAARAASLFAANGMDAVVVDGGINACLAEGAPVNALKTITLERQVRIAAGMLVLTGAILGAVVAPGFYLISAVIGAGLVFAGITDTCGLGLLLAYAPWNRDRTKQAAQDSLRKFEQRQGA